MPHMFPSHASATTPARLADLANTLCLGDEYFWTPDRLVPFHHWAGHIPFVFWLIKNARPRRFVELGTHRGNSYCAMCQAAEAFHLPAVGTAVDTWDGDIHMNREEGIFDELRTYHDPRYSSFSTLHRATFDDARRYFSEGSVDLLHIDGTHTYDAVRHDFELWRPTLSERGVVLLHDIEVRRDEFGVWRLWEELCGQYPAFGFVHSYGLGILGVGAEQPAPLRALLDMAQSPTDTALVRRLFAVRGGALLDRVQSEATRHELRAELDHSHETAARAAEVATQGLGAARNRAAALERDNSDLSRRVAELNSEVAARAAEAAAAKRDNSDLSRRVAELNSEVAARAAEAAAAKRDNSDLSRRVAELNSEVAARAAEAAAAKRDNSDLSRRVAELDSELNAQCQAAVRAGQELLQQRSVTEAYSSALNTITASTTWRMMAPVRAALSRCPGLARFGRRALKAVWWTLTGQLLARLRARRARSELSSHQQLSPIVEAPELSPIVEAPAKNRLRVIPRYIDPADTWRDPTTLSRSRIAVHLHVFYFDLLNDLLVRLRGIPSAFDLFVSVPDFASSAQVNQIERVLHETVPRAARVVIRLVPNRGRDIAPFIVEFGNSLLEYDIVGHFHTKKSPHNPRLAAWRDTILDLLLGPSGNPGGHVSSILSMLEQHAKIVCPEAAVFIQREPTNWAGNYSIARDILAKHTQLSISDFPTVEFAEGTMLWARSAALRRFLELPLSYGDFPPEPIAADGTLAHALERLVFILAQGIEGDLVRLHSGDSVHDYRMFEEAQDFSKRLAHTDVKILAYYLPQFHHIPENDEWHGIGFTEWTKTRAANPLFRGHYQQHIPHPDVGYYLINGADVLRRQKADMHRAGVHGQVFYHYWFSGRLILEHPARLLLKSTDIHIPFCFCWANENWTRRWDGSEDQILLKQEYSAQDARAFIRYLIPFFKDTRYIKVEGRPVLFVYRPTSIVMIATYLAVWQEECEAAGLERPYTVATLAAGATDPRPFGMEAGVERVLYDWTSGEVPEVTSEVDAYTSLEGHVFSYESIKEHYTTKSIAGDFTCFRSLVPNWDNTARYGAGAHVLHGSTPRLFQEWLETLIAQAKRTLPPDRRFIVVNAWNEWAEGAHLEADSRYGYAYLNAVGRALANEPLSEPACNSGQALTIAQAAEEARDTGAMMMVVHRWGGGTERHVKHIVEALAREGMQVFLTRVAVDRPNAAVVVRAGDSQELELGAYDLDGSPDKYARLLCRLHVRHLHVQHLAGFPEGASDWIQLACRAADIPYDITLHDYMAVCPRIVMVAAENSYCGEPPLSQCEICIATNGPSIGRSSVAEWRARYGRLLIGARCRFVPNDDVAERLTRYFPKIPFTVRPHPEPRRNDARLTALQSERRSSKTSVDVTSSDAKRHVAVIGYIAGHKGSEILLNCARFAQRTQAPIRFTVVGWTDRDPDFADLHNVTISGRYEPSEFLDIVERLSPDIGFLPSVCPETYSFTLSETVVAGIYPVVFDLGAMGARVRSLGWGRVLPVAWTTDPEAVVKALLDTTPTPPPRSVLELAQGTEDLKILNDYYQLEWPLTE